MAFTAQSVADVARLPLNDDDKVRYTDAELLTYINSAYLMLRRLRPDLFVGSYTTLPASLALADNFPGSCDVYQPAIADYVTARAESKDDEHVVRERAQAFYQLFGATVKGA